MQGHTTQNQSNQPNPATSGASLSDRNPSVSNNSSFSVRKPIIVLRHGLRKVFRPLFITKIVSSHTRHSMALPLPWRSSTSDGSSVRHYISGNRRIRIIGIVATFVLILLSVATIAPLTKKTEYTEAASGTASETSITIATTDYPTLDIAVNNSNGTFMETTNGSGQGSFSVTTTNYTGYTLSISASDNTGTLVNSGDSDASTNSIASLPTGSSLTVTQFNNTTYNGKWGYKPSMLNSATNTNYLPAPTTTATTINVTECANGKSNGSKTCPATDDYTIDLAARLQYTQNSGDYTKTFVLTAVANKINYSITYNPGASTPSDVTNMPSPNPQSGDTNSTEITLSASTPTREGYTFKGWCTASTGTDGTDTCSGTTYQPTAPDNVFPIDQTTINTTTTLYAMWEKNAEVMQNLADSLCVTDSPTTVKDTRDGKTYTVQRLADGKCWMTSNLNLAGGTALYSDDSNVAPANTRASGTPYYTLPDSSTSGFSWYATAYVYNSNNETASQNDCYNGHPCNSYYSWLAATAGGKNASGSSVGNGYDAAYSICPKGWKLPSSGNKDDSSATSATGYKKGDFYKMLVAYGMNWDNYYADSSTNPTGATIYNEIVANTPGFILSGNYYSSGFSSGGTQGNYWSSTSSSSSQGAYSLSFDFRNVNSAGDYGRHYGFAVRCIKQSDAEIAWDSATMQSVTNDQLATAMPSEGSTASLPDARDGQVYTLAKINGNYWMTRNLAIGCNGTGSTYGSAITSKALTPANSNISSDWTLPATAFDSSNNSTTTGYDTPAMQCNSTYGGHYNYAAATAGTIANASDVDSTAEAQYSICPKGWRLPSQSELSGITSSSSAFSPVYSGFYNSGLLNGTGSTGGGFWWSSTAYDSTNRYNLYYYYGSLGVNYDYRYLGLSVRCAHS